MPISGNVAFKAKSIKVEPTCIHLFKKYLLYITLERYTNDLVKLQRQLWDATLTIWKISRQKSNNTMYLNNIIKKLDLIFWQIHRIIDFNGKEYTFISYALDH